MRVPVLAIIITCNLCWALPKVVDMVIQFQHARVLDGVETVHVLVNGDHLSNPGGDVSGILSALWSEDGSSLLNAVVTMQKEITVNQSTPKNHTIQRIRECRMHGAQVHLTDQILYDGRVYLTLDGTTDTWTSEVAEAVVLKRLWAQNPERTRPQRMQLQERCITLMKQLTRSEPKTGGLSMMTVLSPALALMFFAVLTMASFLISKKQGHPGAGVIGSIVHYPHNVNVPPQEGKDYQVL